jgi:polysaccharide export outer membrane protein
MKTKVLNLNYSAAGIFAVIACFLAGSNVMVGQTSGQVATEPAKPADRSYTTVFTNGVENEDYHLKPGDVVEIKVEKAPELSGTYPLNTNGTFVFPVLGQLKADKQTAEELSQMIADRLRGSYLTEPIVSVSIKEQSKKPVFPFFIQGAVRNPGTFQLEKPPSMLKLITIAGGLGDNFGSTAFVIREKKDGETIDKTKPGDPPVSGSSADTEYDLIKVNLNRLLKGNFEQNIMIQPNDIVQIPKSDIFFVAGDVKAPGNFPLREGTTLRQAISLAQGTKYEAAADRGIIFREDASGKRQEIAVDIGAVMAGKKEDIEILPNDIIMVPNSKMKSFANSMIKTASNGLIRTLFGF